MKPKKPDWQGKREDQINFSQQAVGYSCLAVLIILIVLTILFSMSSCSVKKEVYIKRSDIVVTAEGQKIIYIKDDHIGHVIYNHWLNGDYGKDYIPVLVSNDTFKDLCKKIK